MPGLHYAAYVACAVIAARLVYRYDLYDREPWYLLFAAAVAGAALMHLAGDIEDAAITAVAGPGASPYVPALVAASVEEGARLAIVVAVALFVPAIFNDPMDGLVYGSIAGIGMALEESWAISRLSGGAFSAVEIVRLSGHLTMGGITGFGLGLINRRGAVRRHWVLILAGCVTGSIVLHFLWDVTAIAQDLSGGLAWWPAVAGSAVMLSGMGAYGALVVVGSRWSRQAMAPASRRTLWGWPFSRRGPPSRPY